MPARILIVDDDEDTRALLKLVLQSAGFEPVLAAHGGQALAEIRRQKPDAVLCDILMPVLDGYDTLLAIRADANAHDVPVLMLSALGQEHDVQRALGAGANGYVLKPFAIRMLLDAIHEQLDCHMRR